MKKFILKLFKIKSEEEIRKDERCKVIKEMLEDKEEYEHFVSIIFLYVMEIDHIELEGSHQKLQ